MLVGLISDTHGLLRPEALKLLRGTERIIHAGDVGNPAILKALEQIAPVAAIRGNIDTGEALAFLPLTETVAAGPKSIYVVHNLLELDLDPAAAGFDVVVFGHSHKCEQYLKDGALYINPGSAGPRRFRLPISVALLDTESEPMKAKFLEIKV